MIQLKTDQARLGEHGDEQKESPHFTLRLKLYALIQMCKNSKTYSFFLKLGIPLIVFSCLFLSNYLVDLTLKLMNCFK